MYDINVTDFETKFKAGVLNVLPHNLSHLYGLMGLDFGLGEAKGGKKGDEKLCLFMGKARSEVER